MTTFESLGAGAKHGRRRRHRLLVLCTRELDRGRLGRRREKGEKPVELVGKRREGNHRPGGPSRALRGLEEPRTQTVDRFTREARPAGQLLRVRVEDIRDAAQGRRGFALKVGAPAGRPQEHHREDRSSDRKAPACEAVRDRGVRSRDRYGEDEGEDRAGRARREVAAEHAGEQCGEADDRHGGGSQPRASGAEGPEGDEGGADASEREVREEASPGRTAELR